MFKKLRTRIMLLSVALTMLVMVIAFAAIYFVVANNLQMEVFKKLNEMERGGFPGYAQEDTLSPAYDLSFMLSVDSEGNVLDAYARSSYPDSDEAFDDAARFAWYSGTSGEYEYYNSYWSYKIFDDKDGLHCIAFLEVTNDRNTLSTLLLTLVLVGAGMLAIIFVLCRFFAGRVIRPVSEAWEQQKRFVADASHELKTPLMTIMSNCGVLEANEEETIVSQREWVTSIMAGADRMGRLINHMLMLARVEGMEIQEQKRQIDLVALISEVIQTMSAAAKTKKLRVNVSGMPEQEVFCYGDSLRQVFAILYENAVKYTDEGGIIDVIVRRQGKHAALTVCNTGAGISPEHLPHIFDRFYRADSAREAEENSYGLGLPIARATAERIGGRITAKSEPGQWTEFCFLFEIEKIKRTTDAQ